MFYLCCISSSYRLLSTIINHPVISFIKNSCDKECVGQHILLSFLKLSYILILQTIRLPEPQGE